MKENNVRHQNKRNIVQRKRRANSVVVVVVVAAVVPRLFRVDGGVRSGRAVIGPWCAEPSPLFSSRIFGLIFSWLGISLDFTAVSR